MKNKFFFQSMLYAFIALSIYACSSINVSFLWGSRQLSLTGLSLLFPALGVLLALPQSAILIGLYYTLRAVLGFYTFTFGIPTLVATANWSATYYDTKMSKSLLRTAKFLLQVFVPLICMVLFVTHPIGKNAVVYSLYWFIPVFLFIYQEFIHSSSVFGTALSSTFIAHAVGSVISLYTFSIPASIWISLIPMVAIERLVFAGGTVLVFHTIQKTIALVKKSEFAPKKQQSVTYLN